MSASRAVVFDIGNVLVRWDPRHLYRRLLPDEESVEHFLDTVCTPEWNRRQDAGRPWPEAVAELTARFPAQHELIAAYANRWDEMVPGPVPGTVDVLAELRATGVPCYAVTNFSVEKFGDTRRRFAFLDWFDGIVVSGAEGLVKPDEAIFRLAIRRFGLDPAGTVFIDDVAANVDAAARLGLTAMLFTGAQALRADLVAEGMLPAASGQQPTAGAP